MSPRENDMYMIKTGSNNSYCGHRTSRFTGEETRRLCIAIECGEHSCL